MQPDTGNGIGAKELWQILCFLTITMMRFAK